MQRTNIYLEERQLESLKAMARHRGEPVAGLVRAALDEWLEARGVRQLEPGEWDRRFDALISRREEAAASSELDEQTVEREVLTAVREARGSRPARRR